MKERKTKTLTYKHARFHVAGPVLKTELQKALAKLETIGARREALGPPDESPIWRLIGQFKAEADFLFGVLVRYMPGTNPVFLVDDEAAKTLTVEQMAAPATTEGKRRELVDAMLFFGAIDNHLVMMQSSALRSDHLEAHLQWVLHQAGVIEGTNTLQLVDQMPKKIRETISRDAVRELDIGGALIPIGDRAVVTRPVPAEAAVEAVPAGDYVTATATAEAVAAGNRVASVEMPAMAQQVSMAVVDSSTGIVDALKSLLTPDQAAKLDLEALAGSNIEYTLKIRYRNNTTEGGQKLMNTLGSALRHAEGIDTRVKLVGGGEIRGEDMRLSGSVRIDTYDGIPSADEVFEAIRSWLLEKLKAGDVKASSMA